VSGGQRLALIDGRFNRQRQTEPAQVTGRAQAVRIRFRRDRGACPLA
jgi:hypothetical protein